MNRHQDRIFAGQYEVVLIDGCRRFIEHRVANPNVHLYVAGSCVDSSAKSGGQCKPPPVGIPISADHVATRDNAFVLIAHNRESQCLTILTDRFGLYPLYWATTRGRLYVSTSLSDLCDRRVVSGAINYAALSDVFAFNVPLDNRTLLTGATSFVGGSEFIIDLNSLEIRTRRTWNPIELLRNSDLAFADVKDELVDLFLAGLQEMVADNASFVLTLSGGADSRCLLAASLNSGHRPTATYTTGVPGSRALAYAKAMSVLCGVPHRSCPLDAQFLSRFGELTQQSIRLADGMSFSSEVEAMWLRDHLESGDVLLHGAFAELYKIGKMHNFYYDAKIARLSRAVVKDYLWQRFSSRFHLRLGGLCAEYREMLEGLAQEHLAEKVDRYGRELDTAGILQMLYIDEFLGKVAKCSSLVWGQRIRVCFPFAHCRLVDLIMRVRTRDKISNYFVRYLLQRTNKALAHYPDSNTGLPLTANPFQKGVVRIMDYARRKILGEVRADHQDFAGWLSDAHSDLEQTFAALHSATGMFNPEGIRQLGARCRAGDDQSARVLQFLRTVGLWRAEVLPMAKDIDQSINSQSRASTALTSLSREDGDIAHRCHRSLVN